MGVLSGGILRNIEEGRLAFYCPGCKTHHQIAVGIGAGPRWDWDGNTEAPTFSPSINVTWNEPSDKEDEFDDPSKDMKRVCHSFVRAGKIEFLADCTHSLARMTVPLPPLPGQ